MLAPDTVEGRGREKGKGAHVMPSLHPSVAPWVILGSSLAFSPLGEGRGVLPLSLVCGDTLSDRWA